MWKREFNQGGVACKEEARRMFMLDRFEEVLSVIRDNFECGNAVPNEWCEELYSHCINLNYSYFGGSDGD